MTNKDRKKLAKIVIEQLKPPKGSQIDADIGRKIDSLDSLMIVIRAVVTIFTIDLLRKLIDGDEEAIKSAREVLIRYVQNRVNQSPSQNHSEPKISNQSPDILGAIIQSISIWNDKLPTSEALDSNQLSPLAIKAYQQIQAFLLNKRKNTKKPRKPNKEPESENGKNEFDAFLSEWLLFILAIYAYDLFNEFSSSQVKTQNEFRISKKFRNSIEKAKDIWLPKSTGYNGNHIANWYKNLMN